MVVNWNVYIHILLSCFMVYVKKNVIINGLYVIVSRQQKLDRSCIIANHLQEQGIFEVVSDQTIVNEYEPGQDISAHVDCVPCFGETIASLTLGSGATMQFQSVRTDRKEELYLQERGLIVLSKAARYEWTHAIPTRKSDSVNGFKIERERRVSVTFRNMILWEWLGLDYAHRHLVCSSLPYFCCHR